MRAQVTAEFLVIFTATLLMISILSSALIAQHEGIEGTAEDLRRIEAVKKAARTVELWLNDGMVTGLDFYDEGISFRVEGDRFLVMHEGDVIEVEGIFSYEREEPI